MNRLTRQSMRVYTWASGRIDHGSSDAAYHWWPHAAQRHSQGSTQQPITAIHGSSTGSAVIPYIIDIVRWAEQVGQRGFSANLKSRKLVNPSRRIRSRQESHSAAGQSARGLCGRVALDWRYAAVWLCTRSRASCVSGRFGVCSPCTCRRIRLRMNGDAEAERADVQRGRRLRIVGGAGHSPRNGPPHTAKLPITRL
jgi:hypothetical protein